jgi:hypothetical protein
MDQKKLEPKNDEARETALAIAAAALEELKEPAD